MANPWKDLYDFRNNKAQRPLTVHAFLGILEELETEFPVVSAPAATGKGAGSGAAKGGAAASGYPAKGTGKTAAAPAPAAAAPQSAPPVASKGAAPSAAASATQAKQAVKQQSLFEKQVRPGAAGAGMRADAVAFVPQGKGASRAAAEDDIKTRRAGAP